MRLRNGGIQPIEGRDRWLRYHNPRLNRARNRRRPCRGDATSHCRQIHRSDQSCDHPPLPTHYLGTLPLVANSPVIVKQPDASFLVDRATFSERLVHRPSGGGRVTTGFQADDANQVGRECPYAVNEPPSGCQHHILTAVDDVMFRVIVFGLQSIESSFSTVPGHTRQYLRHCRG